MSEIQRIHTTNLSSMVNRADGDFVLYSDHCAVVEKLKIAHDRYEKVRRMHPRTWLRIYNDCVSGKGTFDELVDKWKEGTP